MSLRSSAAGLNTPYKPPNKRVCIEEGIPTQTVSRDRTDLERVIDRLDRLQASIDNLLAMCLREEHEDSSAVEETPYSVS